MEQRLRDIGNRDVSMIVTVQRLRDIGNRDVSMIVTVQSGVGAETERHWKQRCINDRDSAERCWSRD